jgi:hypothetical protein
MENRDVLYKLVRFIDGPESRLAVFREIAARPTNPFSSERAGEPLREISEEWGGGFLVEDANTAGKYVLAVSDKDMQAYLNPKKSIDGVSIKKPNTSVSTGQDVSTAGSPASVPLPTN